MFAGLVLAPTFPLCFHFDFASDVVSETKVCPSAQMLRLDPSPAKVLGSTYVEQEDVPTVRVLQDAAGGEADGNPRLASLSRG